MALLILKYLLIVLSVLLSVATIYALVIDRSDWYSLNRSLHLWAWVIYLTLLLLIAGIVYYVSGTTAVWRVFLFTLGAGALVWSVIFGYDAYREHKSTQQYEHRVQKEAEYRAKIFQAYREHPNDPVTLVAMGRLALYNNKSSVTYDRFPSDYFVEAIRIDPVYVPAYMELMSLTQNMRLRTWDNEKGFDGDKDLYAREGKRYAQQILTLAAEGKVTLSDTEQRELEEAIGYFDEWLADIAEIAQGQRQNFAKYVKEASVAIEADPDNAALWAKRAFVLVRYQEDYDRALADIGEALRLDNKLAEAHRVRGYILKEMGLCREAIAAYRQAVIHDADLTKEVAYPIEQCEKRIAWAGADRVIVQEFYDDYIHRRYNALYKDAVLARYRKHPDDPDAVIAMGLIQPRKAGPKGEENDEGIPYFLRAVELAPQKAEAYQHLAAAYYLTRQYDEARSLCAMLLKKAEKNQMKLPGKAHHFFSQLADVLTGH